MDNIQNKMFSNSKLQNTLKFLQHSYNFRKDTEKNYIIFMCVCVYLSKSEEEYIIIYIIWKPKGMCSEADNRRKNILERK